MKKLKCPHCKSDLLKPGSVIVYSRCTLTASVDISKETLIDYQMNAVGQTDSVECSACQKELNDFLFEKGIDVR